ncbi:MAG TPA: TonB family protein [Candidatus Polarisedimenticolia bacterium]
MIRIDEKGLVGEVQVIRSADQRWGFDLAAIEAVKQWRYRPASMHGRAASVWGQVIVEFSLSR